MFRCDGETPKRKEWKILRILLWGNRERMGCVFGQP